jgi:MYXO-CTERM domain-containing protein
MFDNEARRRWAGEGIKSERRGHGLDQRSSGGSSRRRMLAILGVVAFTACVADIEGDAGSNIEPRDGELPLQAPPKLSRVPAPLPAAHCDVQVEGQGLLDLEGDYLPHVITCENGGANLEALKAQAIAARSVAYYNMETSGSICDSQGCQVYSCGADPSPLAYQAVDETSGVYLMYNNTLTYGFYVAGDNNTSPPACVGVSGTTEGWVTYNEGRSGTDVEQTELGFVHSPGDSGYGQNRGCMGQWGARCLENDNGYDYLGILRFYYGDDIELVQAEGSCVLPLPGEETTTGEPPATTGMGSDTGELPASTGEPVASTGGGEEDTGTEPPPDDTAPGSGSSGSGDGGSVDGVDPALPGTFGADEDAGGCACRASDSRSSAAWWMLGLLGFARRRRH